MVDPSKKSDLTKRIVEKYSDILIRVAFSYMKNTNDSEDIVQDVFIKFIETEPCFENEEHEKSWFIRVTINLCKNHFKSLWFRKRVALDNKDLGFTPKETRVLESVLELPEKYRIVIHLYYYQGYSIKEIADILGLKGTTVSSQLQRGRKLLKSKLEGDFDYE